MRHIKTIGLLLCALLFSTVSREACSDLQVTLLSVSGRDVGIVIHNPDTISEVTRVQTTVRFADNTTQTITSGDVSISGGTTATVTVVAATTVVSIDDDPVPINP